MTLSARRAREVREFFVLVLAELESERVTDSTEIERARYEGAIAGLDAVLGEPSSLRLAVRTS